MVATILCAAVFSASVLSGMLGVGVAFAAVPILGIAGWDLVDSVQPIALFLNGVSALFAAMSFSRAGFVDWRRSSQLAIVASIFAPLGALAAERVPEADIWDAYFLAVLVVVYLLLSKPANAKPALPFGIVLLMSAPVSAVSGLLGVGPGFLLVPVMIFVGFSPRSAAAMNAVAVTPSSFLSLIPHLGHASVDIWTALPIVLVSGGGAFLGGYLSSTRISEIALRRLFVVVILALSIYKGISLVDVHLGQAVNGSDCQEELIWAGAQAKPCQVSN